MFWFKKSDKTASPDTRDAIHASSLAVEFDPKIFNSKLQQLLATAGEHGGISVFIDALNNKHLLFKEVLAMSGDQLSVPILETLLETIFTSRRKLPIALRNFSHDQVVMMMHTLVMGDTPLSQRMDAFTNAIHVDDKKMRRAAWDFAAELLHFNQPEHYPLMSRWVWDANVVSGAMREFIRANDSLSQIAIENTPQDFEGGRVWLTQQLSEHGFYRDIPFMIDLVLAQAYTDYVMAMSNGMGMMGSEFGTKMESIDFVSKLLGIEPARRAGKSRVKKVSVH